MNAPEHASPRYTGEPGPHPTATPQDPLGGRRTSPSSPPAASDAITRDRTLRPLLATLSDRCCSAADVDAVGVLLADRSGELQLAAWSSCAAPYLPLFELITREGPCLDSYRTNQAVVAHDVGGQETTRRWPSFAPAARLAGLRGALAVPMRQRHRVIGGFSLLRHDATPLERQTLATVQAIADLATLAVLRNDTVELSGPSLSPRPRALQELIVIEQAKGVIAERNGVSIEQAEALLAERARIDRRPLIDVAVEVTGTTPDRASIDSRPRA